MSNVVIWKLQDKDDSYDKWYEFLTWKEYRSIDEVSMWDDSQYTGIIYKAYRVFEDQDLTYMLLKWPVFNKGDYHKWMYETREINHTVYAKKDMVWLNND